MTAEPQEGWLHEVGSACSRLLNALCGGDGSVTFSAASWQLQRDGSRWGAWRVRVVDRLNREPGHCERAWRWHHARGLIGQEAPAPS